MFAAAANAQPAIPIAGPVRGANVHDLGRADAGVRVNLALVLAYRNAAELDRLVEEQSDPESPLFAHFLTAEGFRSAFGPTPQAYAGVLASLRRAGFSIAHTFSNRTIVDASAPAPVVERYFQTEIHRVAVDGGGVRHANVMPAFLPRDLAGVVEAVVGFDNIEWFHPLSRIGSGAVPGFGVNGAVMGLPLRGPGGGYGPPAFAQAYDMPVQHLIPNGNGATYDGSGHTAGIEIPADPSDADLSTFLAYFNITRTGTTARISIDGGPSGSGQPTGEAILDYETIAGIAPGANIDIFEFPDLTNASLLDGFNTAVSDNVADTINSSLAACETADYWMPKPISKIFEQGSAQGQTFHAATGDGGDIAYDCPKEVSVATPSDSPFNTAIGGTRLEIYPNGDDLNETFWNDGSGTGSGGVSVIFNLPSYQKRVPHIVKGGRNLPDLSFDASVDTGANIVFQGRWKWNGGTSLASPIAGACFVELNQVLGRRLGLINGALYRNWLKKGYGLRLVHDITDGKPDDILIPARGYDLATGIGSFDCFAGGSALLGP